MYQGGTRCRAPRCGPISLSSPVVPRRLVSGQDCSERACRAGELVAEAGALGGHHLLRTGRALLDDPASQQFSLHLGHRRFSPRSEEHTSELQSLMRISYAVFCLKKKIPSKYILK